MSGPATCNERPFVDGAQVEPIGNLRKSDTQFLHGSRVDMGFERLEAFKPLSDLDRLRQSTPAEFFRGCRPRDGRAELCPSVS